MPQASNYYTILTAVQSVIQGLNLTDWNGRAISVVVRKTGAYRQQVDSASAPPVIYVSRAKKERVEPKVFNDTVWVWYPVLISTVVGGNRDLNAHIDYYLNWRQMLRESFQSATLAGASPPVWDSNMYPDTLLDETSISKNYDIELLTVEFRTAEQRLTT